MQRERDRQRQPGHHAIEAVDRPAGRDRHRDAPRRHAVGDQERRQLGEHPHVRAGQHGGRDDGAPVRAQPTVGRTHVDDRQAVAGGFGAWKNAGYRFDSPFRFTDEQKIRYSRHTLLPDEGCAHR